MLHESLFAFAPLADGALLIDRDGRGELHRLDPATGAVTPWSQAWRPDAAGWQVAEPGTAGAAPQVSPDGRWVALAHAFTPRVAPRPGEQDVVAIVVSRADASEPRCVGVALREDEGQLPQFTWTADSARLIGAWSGQCEPDPGGRARGFDGGAGFARWPRPMRWFEPLGDGRGETPGVWGFGLRDPLGDVVVASHPGRKPGLALHDLRGGASLAAFADDRDTQLFARGFVAADSVLVDVLSQGERELLGHRILRSDGRSVAAPGPGWRVYTRLPTGDLLLTRDSGASVEQARLDTATFAVESSRPRPDLARFAGPFDRQTSVWTPGLGGVLILEAEPGRLHLAAI